jgi:2-oxoglutarate dehydrogenase E1 component
MHRQFRKPLVVFTPKSLLRHPKCISKIDDFSRGGFMEVIDDNSAKSKEVSRIIFCSGKIYFELLERKEQDKANEVAIVRIEQLYPFPFNQVRDIVSKYKNAEEFLWVQEEPENMGAWTYLLRIANEFKLKVVSRQESASTATGSHKQHDKEQLAIINQAFAKTLVEN